MGPTPLALGRDSDVAKKKTDDAVPAASRRSSTANRGRSAKPAPGDETVALAGVTPAETIDSAADMSSDRPAPAQPDYDKIAHAAYLRYLSRGGTDGGDFDDWIAAERELARRNGS
jgi:hypothetical protein